MKPNEYLICKSRDKEDAKPYLARVEREKNNGNLVVVLEKDVQYKRQTLEIDKKDVKVRLGLNPLPGKVHGFDINNLFRKTVSHDFWGHIHFFVKPEKDVVNLLKKGLDNTAKRLDKMGLSAYTSCFETEIRAKHGKFAGMYKHCGSEDRPNLVWFAPDWAQDQDTMENVIFHEFGHVLRFNGLKTPKMRNRWLRLYQSTIAQVKVDSKTLRTILNSLDEGDEEKDSFRSVLKQATGEESPRVQKAILQWLKETHRITPKELDIMWKSSKLKDIEKHWPDHIVDTHDLKPRLTEYATKNVEETFAEAFAFYAQKKKLPDVFESLMEESLSRIKAEAPRGDEE